MPQLGCDVDQMAALEELFAQHSQNLTSSATRIDGALASLGWWGADSTAFGDQWRTRGRSALIGAANLLLTSSGEVKRNRLEQIAASDGNGGVGGPGAGGASGGNGGGSSWGDGGGVGGSGAGGGGGGGSWGDGSSDPQTELSASWKTDTHAHEAAAGGTVAHNSDGTTTTTRTSTVTLPDGTKQDRTTTVVTDANGNVVSYKAEAGPPEKSKPELKVETELASGSADARQDLWRSTGSTEGKYASASYDASVGAKEHAGYSVTAGSDGIQAKADASVSVGAEASVAGEVHYGVVSAGGDAKVAAEATAEVHTDAGIGPDGAHIGAGGSAEVAATADVNANVDIAGVKTEAGAGAGFGLGVHADVGGSLTLDKVEAKIDFGGYIGLGGHANIDVSVDPRELAGNVVDFGQEVGSDIVGGAGVVTDFVGDLFDW